MGYHANHLVNKVAHYRTGGKKRRRRGKFPPVPGSQRAHVGDKIEKLEAEGEPREKAVAMALNMARARRLGPGGTYRRVGRS